MRTPLMPVRAADLGGLDEALQHANVPTLVPVLFQLTGDERWLSEPYQPTRAPGMSMHDSGGLNPQIRESLRRGTAQAVRRWAEGAPIPEPAPGPERLRQLMNTCMGEPVDPVYEPMMAEEMGFRPEPTRRARASARGDFSVLIIGAGVSGMLASIKLRAAGIEHIVVEKNDNVGGTWLENRYPGAGVDTPSYLYSYSFFDRDWSTHFGKRDEVQGYLEDLAAAYDLRTTIRFGIEAIAAEWDAQTQRWTVTVDQDGRRNEVTANAVITAVGQLNRPKLPRIPGLGEFAGPLFHSSRWPDDLDVTGKRVAVIGTGASAMQIVPAVADKAAGITIFQRSAQWVAPNDVYFTPVPEPVHWLMATVPFYSQWYRFRLNLTFNDKVHPSLQIDPQWPDEERSINKTNDGHRRFFTDYLTEELDGRPDLQAKALPDYPPFGKRMLLDNGWYAALRRPEVELVTEAADEVTPTGVRIADGTEYAADVVVLATGFQATRVLYPMEVRGVGGATLRGVWGDNDASAYLGITVPSFPNLFMTAGPQTVLGHGGSYITTAECQVRYILDALCEMVERGIGALECREDVYAEYTERVDQAHDQMVWSHLGMTNWYRNDAGRVVSATPWRIVDYWRMTHDVDLSDYHATSRRLVPGRAQARL